MNTHTHTHTRNYTTNTGEAERLYADNVEFDELIAALKTGAYFEAYARRRGRRSSGVVASLQNSRLLEFSQLGATSQCTILLVSLHEPY